MHMNSDGLGIGLSIRAPQLQLGTRLPPTAPVPTVEAPRISLGTPVARLLPPKPWVGIVPRPKPAYIPPVVAPAAPTPVVNIQQAAPAIAKPGMPQWAIPAMLGGGGLILLLALMPKKKTA